MRDVDARELMREVLAAEVGEDGTVAVPARLADAATLAGFCEWRGCRLRWMPAVGGWCIDDPAGAVLGPSTLADLAVMTVVITQAQDAIARGIDAG